MTWSTLFNTTQLSGTLIHQACTTGREDECTRSKYVQGGRLSGVLIGSYGGALQGDTWQAMVYAI